MRNLTLFGCMAALAAIGPLGSPVAASAAAPAMVDCKTASMSSMMHDSMGHDAMVHDSMAHDSMSHDSMMSHDAMKPGMSLDQQYLHAMMDQGKMGVKMAHMEAQCGKDAKTREAAAKLEEQFQHMLDEYRVMLQRTP